MFAGCSSAISSPDGITQAESDLEDGLYDQALERYRTHRDERLAATDRPEWENPHFYTLLMGDVELRRDQPAAALRLYTEAEQHGVSVSLVADRYRALATWYINHNELDKAMETLSAYRSRDPLLFDALLDRAAKQLTKQEAAGPHVARQK